MLLGEYGGYKYIGLILEDRSKVYVVVDDDRRILRVLGDKKIGGVEYVYGEVMDGPYVIGEMECTSIGDILPSMQIINGELSKGVGRSEVAVGSELVELDRVEESVMNTYLPVAVVDLSEEETKLVVIRDIVTLNYIGLEVRGYPDWEKLGKEYLFSISWGILLNYTVEIHSIDVELDKILCRD